MYRQSIRCARSAIFDKGAMDAETVAPRARTFTSIGIFGGSRSVSIGTSFGVEPDGGDPVRANRMLVFREARVAEYMWQGDPGVCNRFRR